MLALKFVFTLLLAWPLFAPMTPFEWKNRVYLASFPGSGNHWVRYLLEEATDIATSSVYQDPEYGNALVPYAFPWGAYCCDRGYSHRCRYPDKTDYFVVKTHFPAFSTPFDQLPYLLVIRLVRHPIDCFYSFYTWNPTPERCHTPLDELIPRNHLLRYIGLWRRFEEYWNAQPNVLTIRYEDLMEDQEATFRKIMQAIPFQVSEKKIKQALYKHPPKGHFLKHLDHYTEEDLRLIKSELGPLMEPYGYAVP